MSDELKQQGAIDPEEFALWNENFNHETKVALCQVDGNDLGELAYFFYVEDPHNLGRAIGFIMTVAADGKIEFKHTDPDQILAIINPEHVLKFLPKEQLGWVLNLHAQRVNRS